jgi:ribosomal protein S18 acetylase RimI-like enzyme
MDRSALIELSDLNLAESCRELARRAGGTVVDEDGLLLFAGAHPLPFLVNGAMRTAAGPPADEVLARASAFFDARARGFTVNVRSHADADLEAAATAAGYTRLGDPPAMVLEGRLEDRDPPPGVAVRQVATPADAAAFALVNGEAYSTYGLPRDVTPVLFERLDVLRAPHIASFVAWVGDEPAAAAMTIVTHAVAGIYWVGTRPRMRGRGLAELVTRVATNAGFDRGGRIASLQASVMGEPVYRRMGYVAVTRYPGLTRLGGRRARERSGTV